MLNMMKKSLIKSLVLLLIIVFTSVVSGCNSSSDKQVNEFKSLDELNGKIVAVQSGCGYEELLFARNIKADIKYFSDFSDILMAAKRGKIDAFVTEDVYALVLRKDFPELKFIPGELNKKEVAIALGKKPSQKKYLDQLNEFIDECQKDSTFNKLWDYWITNFDADKCKLEKIEFPKDSLTLTVAFETAYPPFSYFSENVPSGFDIDYINRFCLKYGYKPEYIPLNFDSILPSLESGKYDIGANVYLSEERKDSAIGFTKPYINVNITCAYLSSGAETDKSLLERFKYSFYRNFIKGSRWKMFLNGFGVTVLIVLSSIFLGTLLGFGIYLLCRYSPRSRKFIDKFSLVVRSIPTVLLLMIFYYIIFSSATALTVSITCFSVLFGFSMLSMLEAGVKAVGTNQLETAISQGFSDRSAFFNIILPQAALHFLPTYQDEVISLIKETAVVGYIAVMDITKTCDVIRGITFEAFFPLFSTTIIYFILIAILIVAIKRFHLSITPEKRSKSQILLGINTNI